MKTILELMTTDIHKALVTLWRRLENDYSGFQEAGNATRDDKAGHNDAKENIIAHLIENEPLKIKNLPATFPLAILEALDEYLFLRYGTKHDAPPPLVEIDGETFIIHRQARHVKDINHAKKTGHFRTHLQHHWIIPEKIKGLSVSIKKLPLIGFDDSLLSDKEEMRVYVGSFPDGIEPDWEEEHRPNFLAKGLTDREERWKGIENLLNEAATAKADIVVFPELAICPDLRDRISLWLDENGHTFCFVLPGTFHQEFNGKFYNFSELFGPTGRPLLSHCKLKPAGNLGKCEKISTGNRIDLLDTQIGLIGIPTCIDFCEEGSPFSHLWEQIGADWFLVPAFGGTSNISAHLRRAKALNRAHGTITALSNQTPSGEDKDHGFVCFSKSPIEISPENRCISVDIEYARCNTEQN
ncbi:MAG: hypothetical protein GY737_24245 [Desulfobacteraceae bacterium]|nr:hypothetical protein [Desulfobacteraceae bacterium]